MLQMLLEARKRLGLTQSKMAEKLGITRNYLALIETGKRPVPTKIAEWLLTEHQQTVTKAGAVLEERDDAYGSSESLRKENMDLRSRISACERREAELLEIIKNLTSPQQGRAVVATADHACGASYGSLDRKGRAEA